MGFDINIEMVLHMCNKTGKPYYYNYSKEIGLTRMYEIPSIEVPEHLRKYLVGRGTFFHAYTESFNLQDIYQTSADQFLEDYPSWTEITTHDSFSEHTLDYWKEDDHIKFKELLKWCVAQGISFQVSWSY